MFADLEIRALRQVSDETLSPLLLYVNCLKEHYASCNHVLGEIIDTLR